MSLYSVIKNLTLYAAIVLMILGLVLPITYTPNPPSELIMIIVGLVLGFVSLGFAVIVTWMESDEVGIDDLIFHNSLTYVIIVGSIFLIGYLAQPLGQLVESLVIDIGLIIGLFVVLMYIWIIIGQKLGILKVDLDINFTDSSDKAKIPQFLLTSLLLGAIFSVIYIIFKFIYYAAGYNIACLVFTIFVLVFNFTISFTLFYVGKIKNK